MSKVDCRNDPRMKRIYYLMGIENVAPLPLISFSKELEFEEWDPLLNQEEIAITEKLKESTIDHILFDELDFGQGVISYMGRKVLVFIQEQDDAFAQLQGGVSKYRFHLTHCGTLEQMENSNRSYRYRVTRRMDGYAPVFQKRSREATTHLVKMDLCRKCEQRLIAIDLYPKPFTFQRYFQQFHTDEAVSEYRSVRRGRRIEHYSPGWDEIEYRYRFESRWTCQVCQVHLEGEKNLLHVHHMNGNPGDNDHDNLRVLCVACRSSLPGCGNMRNKHWKEIEVIHRLRKQQGIQ